MDLVSVIPPFNPSCFFNQQFKKPLRKVYEITYNSIKKEMNMATGNQNICNKVL